MGYKKLIFSILVLVAIGLVFNKLRLHDLKDKNLIDYDLVRKYLLDEKSLAKIKKPILWIPISYNINARKWDNFYSRNTYELNQPYLYLTIKSIIDKCGDNFHICLIDDKAIGKLLPNWKIDLSSTANPIKEHLKNLALCKILYNYGGLIIPPSFICFKCFGSYYRNLDKDSMIVGEFLNRSGTEPNLKYYPNTRLMGCKKESKTMAELCNYLEQTNSKNYTSSYDFLDLEGSWCYKKLLKNEIDIIPAKDLGVKDNNNNAITIDKLLNNSFVQICDKAVGLYIPQEELLKRTAYNWFVYLDIDKVLVSDTVIGKYLLLSQE